MREKDTACMLIRAECQTDAERIAAAFEAAKIAVRVEKEAEDTLIYVSEADEMRAQEILKEIGQLSETEPAAEEITPPIQGGRMKSIGLTLLLLLLVTLVVFGTDKIMEFVMKLFS